MASSKYMCEAKRHVQVRSDEVLGKSSKWFPLPPPTTTQLYGIGTCTASPDNDLERIFAITRIMSGTKQKLLQTGLKQIAFLVAIHCAISVAVYQNNQQHNGDNVDVKDEEVIHIQPKAQSRQGIKWTEK